MAELLVTRQIANESWTDFREAHGLSAKYDHSELATANVVDLEGSTPAIVSSSSGNAINPGCSGATIQAPVASPLPVGIAASPAIASTELRIYLKSRASCSR